MQHVCECVRFGEGFDSFGEGWRRLEEVEGSEGWRRLEEVGEDREGIGSRGGLLIENPLLTS